MTSLLTLVYLDDDPSLRCIDCIDCKPEFNIPRVKWNVLMLKSAGGATRPPPWPIPSASACTEFLCSSRVLRGSQPPWLFSSCPISTTPLPVCPIPNRLLLSRSPCQLFSSNLPPPLSPPSLSPLRAQTAVSLAWKSNGERGRQVETQHQKEGERPGFREGGKRRTSSASPGCLSFSGSLRFFWFQVTAGYY